MSPERLSDVRVAALEDPLLEMPGESCYAIRAPKMHRNRLRPLRWRGKEHGFVIHTTGSALPERAHRNGLYPTVVAADWYFKKHGPQYVCGWEGFEGGDLLQVANEHIQSNGVGTTEQRAAERDGTWTKKVKAAALKQWRLRHPGLKDPRGLLPKGARSVNVCMIQMEMIPCVFWVKGKKFFGAEPMRKGLKFTEAQHDTVAFLACDIAERLEWPDDWQNDISRLGGHEDHTPISRTDRNGGWDPGGMRANPYFDWTYVLSVIEDLLD